MRDEFLGLLLTIFFQAHFALVLYTHFKNSDLTKSSGGCIPDLDHNVQMSNVPTDFSDESRGVGGN